MSQAAATSAAPAAVSDVLEHNLAALGIGGNTIEKVRKAEPSGRIVHLPDGNPVLSLEGRLLGIPADFESRSKTLADIVEAPNTVVAVLGLGMGHAVREIRARTKARVVVYEPDPGLLRRVLEWGPSDLGGVSITADLVDFRLQCLALRTNRPRVTLVCTTGYRQAFPHVESLLGEAIQSFVDNVHMSENTHYLRSKIWLTDIFENLEHLAGKTTFLSLRGRYAGVPAFIVGAGPSLDKNAHLLDEASRKGIVFAVNTSGRALAKRNVTPQVLACLESIDLSKDMAHLPFIDEVVRAFSLSGSPQHFSTGKGPILPVFELIRLYSPLAELVGEPGLAVGSSVTTLAFMLAERLGCNPIVLVGQDLAFTGNHTYASGTPYEGSTVDVGASDGRVQHKWSQAARESHGTTVGALPDSSPLHHAPAWGGRGTVPTWAVFAAVRDWFATGADVLRRARPQLRLVNATEGGARIPNFEESTLADFLAPLPELNITSQSIAEEAARAGRAITRDQIRTWAERQIERIRRVKQAAALVEKLVNQALAALVEGSPAAITRVFRRLESAEKGLRESCAEQPFIEAWACAELQRLKFAGQAARIEKSSRAEAEHALSSEQKVAETISRAADELEEILSRFTPRSRE